MNHPLVPSMVAQILLTISNCVLKHMLSEGSTATPSLDSVGIQIIGFRIHIGRHVLIVLIILA